MADISELFKTLKDAATGAGEAPISRIEGEAAAAQEGLIGFSFKDSSGNVILPQLDSSGRILVQTQAEGTKYFADGQSVSGSTSAFQEVAAITTLGTSADHNNVEAHGSCSRISLFQIVSVDDYGGSPVETVLASFMVGPGQFTVRYDANNLEFTSGSTGTQALVLQGKNLFQVSDLHGDIGCQAV